MRRLATPLAIDDTPLRELTYHTGSHSVTCHPTEVTFPPLPPAEAGTIDDTVAAHC